MPTREEIILAVGQHAAQNGGVPLGKRRFQAVTGYSDSSWAGKYWVRWNDLLVEAGFEPNEWNKPIHEREVLLRQLAEFALELGHFPVIAEKNFRSRTQPGFPYDSSFRTHVGNTQPAQARALAEYALTHPEFRDVYEMCLPLIADVEPVLASAATAPGTVGRVYLINRAGSSYYKIGESENPERRARELQTGVPERLAIVHVLETDDPKGIERYWHRRFENKLRGGEWFDLSDPEVEAFKRRGSFM